MDAPESQHPSDRDTASPAERLDLARCLLILLWQGYDAAGHSLGRSRCCLLLEAAMHVLGEPRPEAREGIEGRGLELIERAREIHRRDTEAGGDAWFKQLSEGGTAHGDFVEALRREIESGFEDRMR